MSHGKVIADKLTVLLQGFRSASLYGVVRALLIIVVACVVQQHAYATSQSNRAGVVQTMNYDASTKLTNVTSSFGHQLALGYDTQGHLLSVVPQ